MYSIGEFSKITLLSIKSLRLYHEKGLLIPAQVDEWSNYRYYDEKNYETAQAIRILRSFEFSLAEIQEILQECDEDENMLLYLEKKLVSIEAEITRYQNISRQIMHTLQIERERSMSDQKHHFSIEEKTVETMLIAGYRMNGRYDEIGKGFQIVMKAAGRFMCGKPMGLYFDGDYKENDADFEAAIPVRKGFPADKISVRELPGGKCLCLIHKGAYDSLHESYKMLYDYVNANNLKTKIPSREIYIKGPGMILKGNPNNYLTEIQFMLEV